MVLAHAPRPVSTVVRPVRVVIADHQEFARVGIKSLLERGPEVQVVGTAGNSAEALQLVEGEGPDVVLVDASLPPAGWLDVTRGGLRPGGTTRRTRIMLMAQELTDDTLLCAMRAGVHGYVLKNSPDWVFSTAIRSVADGEPFLAGPAIRRLFSRFTLLPNHDPATVPGELADLSSRELEVVRGIGNGLSNREIARRLGVAENTIKSYASSILTKLNVRNRVEVALTACRLGLVPLYPALLSTQRGAPGAALAPRPPLPQGHAPRNQSMSGAGRGQAGC
ncbi:response regulator transcription factor [Streptomyces sp. NPDC059455]|uniref:response regulator transcription factor n=1 Tax=Streptomyces sp. NPDC059455 TaxID=3346837 RepID=UPI0036D165C6